MKNNSMYYKSRVVYENTIRDLQLAKQNPTLEDAAFDLACFNAQQTIEFMLKAILIDENIPFEKKSGHNILYLYNLVKDNTDFAFIK